MQKIVNEFVLIFRMNITDKEAQPTPEQMKIYLKRWDKWINNIAAQNKLAEGGNHLSREGSVLRPNNVLTNGPYTEKRESVAGYIIIKAMDLNEAIDLAKDCPILQGEGTSVEVRKVGTR